ncbi:hypothetical protein PFLUV_G00205360 [Perca fluviatilis]|uniref:DH domain-containing protein n=1 Tax=Perca fluviatilis TaxID=8168 RepID=A0A6A5EPH4_PERFL|nr:hypothetical protein PFLUV_G00205360 [Perca fluviatilis]
MRGWLCRRKWKIIVQDYISSPHAESMRKRNQIVFNMVEAETEYVHQLSILVNCFLRPLRMAASSKKPPISHDDVSTIFLNSGDHHVSARIFHQGLNARSRNRAHASPVSTSQLSTSRSHLEPLTPASLQLSKIKNL